MSAASTDRNLKLMRELRPPARSYDPLSPDQILCFLDPEFTLTDRGHRMLALLRSETVHPDARHRRCAFARREHGERTLQDFAETLRWDLSNTCKVWEQEIEANGLGQRDEDGRLWLAGKVEKKASPDGQTKGEEEEITGLYKRLPRPQVLWIQSLDSADRDRVVAGILQRERYKKQLEADAVAAARAAFDSDLQEYLRREGFKGEKGKGRPRREAETLLVTRATFAPFEAFVQTSNSVLHKRENGNVQTDVSLSSSEDQSQEVSERAKGRQSKPVKPAPQPSPPPASPPKHTSHKELNPDPIIATVEELLHRRLSPTDPLRQQFAETPGAYEIPVRSVCRFLVDKWEEKKSVNYRITSAGALYQFLKEDLPGWIRQHEREIRSDLKWSESEKANAATAGRS